MISPETRALCALFLFPLLLPAETRLPRPPETPYIYEYRLPPGPARPIDEYLLSKVSPPVAAAAAAPAVVTAPVKIPAAPAPERSAQPALPEPSRPVPKEEKAGPAASPTTDPTELADLEPDLYARLDDSFSLYFAGDTWLFTESYPDRKGVEYRGRSREAGGVRFSFRARELGRYLLAFVLGRSGGGAVETKRVLVEILPEEEFLSRIGADESGSEQTPGEADEKIQSGEITPQELYAGAWELLLAGEYTEGYALLSSRELAAHLEKPELAAALFIAGTAATLRWEKASAVPAFLRRTGESISAIFLIRADVFQILSGSLCCTQRSKSLGTFRERTRFFLNWPSCTRKRGNSGTSKRQCGITAGLSMSIH